MIRAHPALLAIVLCSCVASAWTLVAELEGTESEDHTRDDCLSQCCKVACIFRVMKAKITHEMIA